MTTVKRNKQKMSGSYKQAKEYFNKVATYESNADVLVLLDKMYWYRGEWCGIMSHSIYGDTHNFVRH